MKKKSYIFKVFLFLLVSLLGALVWNESLLYSQNKILFNSHWESYKKNFYGSGAGAVYSILSRNLLPQNRLVLNKNLGHQILFTRTDRAPSLITVEAEIEQNGYIDILINADEKTFEGFRLSRVPGESSFFYKAELSGKFLDKTVYKTPVFFADKKSVIELRSFGEEIYFIVNHQLIARQKTAFRPGKLGLYTSLQGLIVSKFEVVDRDGKREVLTFSRDYNRSAFYLKNYALQMVVIFLLAVILFKIFDESFIDVLIRTAFFTMAAGVLWFSFDYFYYSKIPRHWSYQEFTFENKTTAKLDFEKVRYKVFRKWFETLGGEVETVRLLQELSGYFILDGVRSCEYAMCVFSPIEKIIKSEKGDRFRVAYIGGSFADYAGITKIEESFFDRLGEVLNDQIPSSEVTNFVFSGIIFREKVGDIYGILNDFKPDLIILSVFMENEDFTPFRRFIKHFREQNVPILYYAPLNETVDLKAHKRVLKFTEDFKENKQRRKFWKKLNFKKNVYFVDSDKSIRQKGIYDKGLVWWDSNHMTVFAQQFVADDLAEYVMDLLNKRPLNRGL